MTQIFTAQTVASLELTIDEGLPPFASLVGTPTIGIKFLAGDGMGPGSCAVWSADSGGLRYDNLPGGESGFLLAGRARITPDGEEPQEIGPGEGFLLPAGWSGTFEALEPVRKVFYLLA